MVFGPQMQEHCENMVGAKTLKIVLPSRRNIKFQEIDVCKNDKIEQKSYQNCMFFGTSILDGFCEGLWRVWGY